MKLIITKQYWIDKDQFPEHVSFKDAEKIPFRKYTDVANYLDTRPELKNRVMLVTNSKSVLGNKVIFDDFVFIENRGHV